ncbi:sigma-70 family RNA polymerase sigma factor [Chryseobacterium sp. G0240]|uniref:sigma-70 family RNA polymerase sigma factor n=1 Tax=Chryseobacterium sp. G0240 TaxID=2487066 RepID=UPI000F44C28D|nr:sigma-70 family RNA polymerase sigma factor [Chryseobacterium sp. G0240]ROI02522.1 sigma-70 family RNA polymerase sigma factor [Chryseobacterium sp. G0240]
MWSLNKHNNDEQVFHKLVHKYNPLIYSLIYKKIQKGDDIFDVFQNILMHLWEHKDRLSVENIEGIIIKTCIQEIAIFYRRSTKIDICELPITEKIDPSVEDLSLIEEKEQYLEVIENAIEDLYPPLRQKIFKMNKLDGITQELIAINLNLSKRTVEHHISKAIIFLKNRIQKS